MKNLRFISILLLIIILSGLFSSCGNKLVDVVERDLIQKKISLKNGRIYEGIVYNGWVYYSNQSDGNKLYKIRTDGTKKTKLINNETKVIDIIDDWVYVNICISGHYNISKIDLDGKNKTKIIDNGDAYQISEGKIFFDKWEEMYSIYVADLNGNNILKLSSETYGIRQECNGWVYYIDYFDRNIYKVKIDGTTRTKANNNDTYKFIVLDDWVFYRTTNFINENGPLGLYKIKNDGTENQLIIDKAVSDFCISDNVLYYSDGGSIYKSELDGTKEKYLTDAPGFGGMSAYGDWIYMIEMKDHNPLHLRFNKDTGLGD